MREIRDSIETSFQGTTIRKADVEALIESEISSKRAAFDHEHSEAETRDEKRSAKNLEIVITDHEGTSFRGETSDLSHGGVGFKSDKRFDFYQIVAITPISPSDSVEWSGGRAKIVRIAEARAGFYYGATISPEEISIEEKLPPGRAKRTNAPNTDSKKEA